MRSQSQFLSLIRCSRVGYGAYFKQNRKIATWIFKSSDYRNPDRAIPQYFNFAKNVLDQWSQLEKDGLRESSFALWDTNIEGEKDKWSFERMTQFSQKTASILSDICALRSGDQLMLILPPVPETYWIVLACMRLGITFIPCSPKLTSEDILYRLYMSKTQCIVTNEDMAPLVDSVVSNCRSLKTKLIVSDKSYCGWLDFKKLIRVAPLKKTYIETKSQDPMAIIFTNRTIGAPQLVTYSQYGLGMRLSQASRQWMDLQSTDVLWCLSDAFGGTLSLSNALGAWLQGACVFLCHMPTFSPDTVLKVLQSFPITTLSGNPWMYQDLLQHKSFSSYRFKSLRHCVTAGGIINLEVIKEWKRVTNLDIHEGYGKTETGLLCATSKRMKLKPGSLGKPLPPYIVQIVDENSNVLPPGEEGNIAVLIKPNQPNPVYCPHMVSWEEYSSARGHKFYLTGDRGIMDEDGYFWWTGRVNDNFFTPGPEMVKV